MPKPGLVRLMGHEKRKEEVNQFISAYWREHFASPSIRDISRTFNTSTSYIRWILEKLETDGKLIYVRSHSRMIIPKWVPAALQQWRAE